MKTNKQKYDEYYAVFSEAESKYINSIFPNGLPIVFYGLGNTELQEHTVTGCYLNIKGVYKSSAKVTNKEVEFIKHFVENLLSFNLKDLRISYKKKYGDGKYFVTGAEAYSNIVAGEKLAFDKNALQEAQEKLRIFYTLKEGDIHCAYCGKAFPEKDAIHDWVIARQYPNGRKYFDYCSTQCASYNQMAHEG